MVTYGPEALIMILGTLSYFTLWTGAVWWAENEMKPKTKRPAKFIKFHPAFVGLGILAGAIAFFILLVFFVGVAWLLRGF